MKKPKNKKQVMPKEMGVRVRLEALLQRVLGPCIASITYGHEIERRYNDQIGLRSLEIIVDSSSEVVRGSSVVVLVVRRSSGRTKTTQDNMLI